MDPEQVGRLDPREWLGRRIHVVIDRPLGSTHPDGGFTYEVNYGYAPGFIAPDEEELDAYVLGPDEPVDEFVGDVIAVVLRRDDIEDTLGRTAEARGHVRATRTDGRVLLFGHSRRRPGDLALMQPALIVVHGEPVAGKSTLARSLGTELMMPVFDRDDFKDQLFDNLGWSDRDWSAKVGAASWDLLLMTIERLVTKRVSVIAESTPRCGYPRCPRWSSAM